MATQSGTPRGDARFSFGMFLFFWVAWSAVFLVWPEWRVNNLYVEDRCVVLDRRQREDPPSVYRGIFNGVFPPEFLIQCTVAGQEYQTWADDPANTNKELRRPPSWVRERFAVGEEYPCWYDPADPSQVVLDRGYSWFSYVFPVAFVVSLSLIAAGVIRRRSGRQAAEGTGGVGA